tara:strand:- start:2104 stop:2481 length:378 start_codon:yes stop_codon:yes gene_type:complete
MITNPIEIDLALRKLIKAHVPPLQLRKDDSSGLEASGTIPAMQGKKKVDGFYFASIIPKPKDTRLYFFPIYTHCDHFAGLPPILRKCLKGKSCFHFKHLNEELEKHISKMVEQGVLIYQKAGLVA